MRTSRIPAAARSPVVVWWCVALLHLASTSPLACQLPCTQQGSEPRALAVVAGPPLGCAHAPDWPAWHHVLPAHRAVVPKQGFHQGEARALPCLLLQWRCTGLLLAPVAPLRLRTLGYVLDVAEVPCVPAQPVTP